MSLHLDFETASRAELRRVGAHAYARHPTTQVLCLAWAFDDEPVAVWRPGQPFPMRIILYVLNGGIVHGWNVTFEWLIWNHVLSQIVPQLPHLEPGQLHDTMARAAYWGLPLKLEQAAEALALPIRKDMEGHRLMLQMCRPRTVKDNGEVVWWHETDPKKYDRLCDYCGEDVNVERMIGAEVEPFHNLEQRIWSMDLAMNARGVPIDTELVKRLRGLAQAAMQRANIHLTELTGGLVTAVTNAKRLTNWLAIETHYPHADLRKNTVAERLADPECIGLERTVLELRADNGKTSVAKLDAMLAAAGVNNGIAYIRGMLQYHGALRTGRWAGRLVQLQNIPRGTLKAIDEAIDAIFADAGLDDLELFYSSGLDIVVSALRGCISPPPGHKLYVADFSQIEARVLCWLARQMDMLAVFADAKRDPYLYQAGLQGSTNRQFGKVLVLALGYGMKAERFLETAKLYGVTLTLEQAQKAVRLWRRQNDAIVALWDEFEDAAFRALRGDEIEVNGVKFKTWRKNLLVRLPSGHVLIYRNAKAEDIDGRKTLTYMGLDQYTRKWSKQRTWGAKLTENIVQALARDVMAEAALEAEAQNLLLCLMVHDELIGECLNGEAHDSLNRLLAIMHTAPAWAPDLPVAAAGFVSARYRK